MQTEEAVEAQSPLLNPAIQNIEGKVIYPGNTTLLSLNLSGQPLTQSKLYVSQDTLPLTSFLPVHTGNKLTPKSLQMFLSSLGSQGNGGLRNISLNVRLTNI